MVDYDDLKVSSFNSAMFKMIRLHESLDKVNKLNQDPLGIDILTGEENYQLIFRALTSLYLEAYPNLDKESKQIGEDLRSTIEEYIDNFPARKVRLRDGRETEKMQFKKEHWDKIKKALLIYEKKVREFISITGMDTPERVDDTEGL